MSRTPRLPLALCLSGGWCWGHNRQVAGRDTAEADIEGRAIGQVSKNPDRHQSIMFIAKVVSLYGYYWVRLTPCFNLPQGLDPLSSPTPYFGVEKFNYAGIFGIFVCGDFKKILGDGK